MKLIIATGGLGNQMFGYAFMLRMAQQDKACFFHPFKDTSKRYGHGGYQLKKVFGIQPGDTPSRVVVLMIGLYWHLLRILPKKVRPFMLHLIGMKEVKLPENFVYYPWVFDFGKQNVVFMGTFQSELFFHGAENEVLKAFSFNQSLLNDKTVQLMSKLEACESVALHVRRDDYLSPSYAKGFGDICTIDYYNSAIKFLKERVNKPVFYVFSDDIQWCRANLELTDMVFVDWNHDEESWQDMFLMSKCKYNIIANSSFSWWGAWLNEYAGKIVVAPDKWWNGLKDEVVPEEWIRISGEQKG